MSVPDQQKVEVGYINTEHPVWLHRATGCVSFVLFVLFCFPIWSFVGSWFTAVLLIRYPMVQVQAYYPRGPGLRMVHTSGKLVEGKMCRVGVCFPILDMQR